ncbi:hypothetical protein DL240_04605 [Lujinxingia litoralis]|uniref:Uncharacterized protein n=1 Tax=Lujinxingia litoralis TaxID=2211119 RepID=A0A328CCN4_9DELT|nr:hypothetical protein [Lujinxingia litoralis]RAL25496.1 hypothetical protein DL240_04605 [Lujinxingia litoralis]
MSLTYYRELVREFFDGKRVILAMGTVAGSAGRVQALRELGVAECLLVGNGLNTRTGGAFGWLARGEPELPLPILEMMIRKGGDLDFRPAESESLIVNIADTHRVDDDLQYDALLLTGPSAMGGFVRVLPVARGRRPGASVAPEVAAAWELTDREFGTGIGALEAPQDVRDLS